jgi:hypothetical protein
MRKRTRRRIVVPMPPPGLRPKLSADQVQDLGLAHWENLDALAKGEGTVDLLWQVVGGVFTWSKAADLLATRCPDYQPAVDEMRAQLDLATRLVERYGATGRVLLTGPDYQLAKRGAAVMDELAKVVDRAIAVAAADWSEAYVSQLAARHARPVFPKAPAIADADIPY